MAFPLPDGATFHEVTADESTAFEPRSAVRPLAELTGVTLREADGGLLVRVEVERMSWPSREWRPEPVRLNRGEWLRWQINYRFGSTCECGAQWRYQLDTLNLAYGAAPDFTGTPTRTVTERGDLR
ncbi:MAG TPA: hypothetical protein VGL47_08995 [Amycolatopsis sp.]|uniref:hypothetical protein n=1 Tax=Amycolatopsis sp. TaxID=37632 RepID=UPI002F3E3C59